MDLLGRLEAANAQLDASLEGLRDRQEQERRARDALQHTIMSAQAQIAGTSDYIRARRGGVGSEARTRLAEAERNLQQAIALQSSDPVSALAYAQQANALAAQASQMAQQDVDGFGGMGGWGGGGGMYGGRGGGSGLGGAILGGILIDSILRGGSTAAAEAGAAEVSADLAAAAEASAAAAALVPLEGTSSGVTSPEFTGTGLLAHRDFDRLATAHNAGYLHTF